MHYEGNLNREMIFNQVGVGIEQPSYTSLQSPALQPLIHSTFMFSVASRTSQLSLFSSWFFPFCRPFPSKELGQVLILLLAYCEYVKIYGIPSGAKITCVPVIAIINSYISLYLYRYRTPFLSIYRQVKKAHSYNDLIPG